MACENSGLTLGLKPGELKTDLLRSDRRAVRSQNIFLNLAGRSFGKFFDEGDTMRRLEANSRSSRSSARARCLRTTKGVRRFARAFMRGSAMPAVAEIT